MNKNFIQFFAADYGHKTKPSNHQIVFSEDLPDLPVVEGLLESITGEYQERLSGTLNKWVISKSL